MRKPFVLLMVISIVLFTGCSSLKNSITAKTPQINIPFTCGFNLTAYDDMELEGTMKRYGTGIWEMDITSPETMAGLHIKRTTEGMDISLGELEICIGQDKINRGAFAELIFNAVDSCAALQEMTLEETQNGLQYTGKVSECPFIMTFSPETLLLTEISFPSIDLHAKITDFCPVADTEPSETSAVTELTTVPESTPPVTTVTVPATADSSVTSHE